MTAKLAIVMNGTRFLKNFLSYKDRDDIIQTMVAPRQVENTMFNISNIVYYDSVSQISRLIKRIRPNVLLQTSTSFEGYSERFFARPTKKVFVSSGLYADCKSVERELFRERKKFKVFDLIVVSSQREKNMFECTRIPKEKIMVHSLPQFDLINKEAAYRQKRAVLSYIKFVPEKIVLFAGERFSAGEDIRRVKDTYDTIIILSQLAEKNNWVVLIKPKNHMMTNFIQNNAQEFSNDYLSKFVKAISSKNVKILNVEDVIYYYFFSDVIVDNGGSTVGMEACIANRPFVSVSDRQTYEEMDIHSTLSSGCGIRSDIENIEHSIYKALNEHSATKQNKFLDSIGLKREKNSAQKLVDFIIEWIK